MNIRRELLIDRIAWCGALVSIKLARLPWWQVLRRASLRRENAQLIDEATCKGVCLAKPSPASS